MPHKHYILTDEGEPVTEPDLLRWAGWFDTADRLVRRTTFPDGTIVSTVFLGIDHNFCGWGPPILWETKVFGDPHDQPQWRCSGSREQAEAMHNRAVALTEAALKNKGQK